MVHHSDPVDVALLLVGDELLAGHTRDANGQYLASRIVALGHRVVAIHVSPDEDAAIVRDLESLLEIAPFVIVTGGLGPTHDDRTTEAIAKGLGIRLVVDEAALTAMARKYETRYKGGIPPHVVEAGRKMVTVPQGATLLRNPVGSAVGYAIPRPPGAIVVLPGVPAEMQAMFEQEVAGKIIPTTQPLHVEEVGLRLPEAEFSKGLALLASQWPSVAIGSYPKSGSLEVVIRMRGPREDVLKVRYALEAAWKQHVIIRARDSESG